MEQPLPDNAAKLCCIQVQPRRPCVESLEHLLGGSTLVQCRFGAKYKKTFEGAGQLGSVTQAGPKPYKQKAEQTPCQTLDLGALSEIVTFDNF